MLPSINNNNKMEEEKNQQINHELQQQQQQKQETQQDQEAHNINNEYTELDEQQLNENEIHLLNSDDVDNNNYKVTQQQQHQQQHQHKQQQLLNNSNAIDNPLIIKKLNTNHQIKIPYNNVDKIETNENNNLESEVNNNFRLQLENEDTIKEPGEKHNNSFNINNSSLNLNANSAINANNINSNSAQIPHFKSYTPPLFNNQQFILRYKDPKTGKLFSKVLFDRQDVTPVNASYEDFDHTQTGNLNLNVNAIKMSSRQSNERKMGSTTPTNSAKRPLTSHVALFRTQSSAVSRTKVNDRSYYPTSITPLLNGGAMSPTNLNYSWKGKNERNPFQLAPDRLYLNTYMEKYANNQQNLHTINANANQTKVTKIKFERTTPRNIYSARKSTKSDDSSVSTSQVFEHIFDMNSQFINTYFPQVRRQNSSKISSRAHTLPGHIALQSSIEAATSSNQNNNPNSYINNSPSQLNIRHAQNGAGNSNSNNILPSRRPLKFENPSIYKTSVQRSTSFNTQRPQTKYSYSVTNSSEFIDDYDLDSIEIPIVLKSPSSVNSYINYLRTRSPSTPNSMYKLTKV